ncbi:MerR family transcriptional regulator [Paenibacillus whitsoniae]|uniref:MerR family transcriptional regulator n=1 Tax=Paenibacillus whitsoniae TaxID=2496558 RepID=A0A3S0BTG6_9BACL|nr:MerR family transcriptional regulator [Paenibacillus whitsoniae]RTE07992.1 MerR family transcriptional regulator [Paenibacillus whitsoniae]
MLYTVKEVSELAHVTIKTLHHYHKIGLLLPREVSEAGYRMYGQWELERLQEILFYKELDFSLEQIGELLAENVDRTAILAEQHRLMQSRQKRLTQLIITLEASLAAAKNGGTMNQADMFKGFGSEAEWREALEAQNQHLKENYGYDLAEQPIDVPKMNEQAAEAVRFMKGAAACLREGRRHDGPEVAQLIAEHLAFLQAHGHAIQPDDYAAQSRFFLGDDFHRSMLEAQQVGLAYYLCLAAEAYAAGSGSN